MKSVKIKLSPSEALVVISALKMWGKSRYNKSDKLIAHDIIDKVLNEVDQHNE